MGAVASEGILESAAVSAVKKCLALETAKLWLPMQGTVMGSVLRVVVHRP